MTFFGGIFLFVLVCDDRVEKMWNDEQINHLTVHFPALPSKLVSVYQSCFLQFLHITIKMERTCTNFPCLINIFALVLKEELLFTKPSCFIFSPFRLFWFSSSRCFPTKLILILSQLIQFLLLLTNSAPPFNNRDNKHVAVLTFMRANHYFWFCI